MIISGDEPRLGEETFNGTALILLAFSGTRLVMNAAKDDILPRRYRTLTVVTVIRSVNRQSQNDRSSAAQNGHRRCLFRQHNRTGARSATHQMIKAEFFRRSDER